MLSVTSTVRRTRSGQPGQRAAAAHGRATARACASSPKNSSAAADGSATEPARAPAGRVFAAYIYITVYILLLHAGRSAQAGQLGIRALHNFIVTATASCIIHAPAAGLQPRKHSTTHKLRNQNYTTPRLWACGVRRHTQRGHVQPRSPSHPLRVSA